MMPYYKAKTLTGDMLLSPFEIFIYLPDKELKEQQEKLRKIWGELERVSSIFDLQFISKESLIENDPYLERVFEHSNIFARILMPRTGDRIGIEIGWIGIYDSQEESLKGDLLRFVSLLCEKGLEQVYQVKIDTECFVIDSQECDERLYYLSELERRLVEIIQGVDSQTNVNPRPYLAYNRIYRRKGNYDYLTDDFEANKRKLEVENKDSLSFKELAALVGFDIPYITESKIHNQDSIFYDPSVSITVVRLIPGTKLPGLRIGIGRQNVNVPTRSREGIFAYVCTLIRYINGKSFGKKDINRFMDNLKKYSNYKVLDNEDLEEPSGLFESAKEVTKPKKINKIRHFDRGIILYDKMPPLLLSEYYWFKKIYDALFRIGRSFDHVAERRYIGNMNFEQWCIHVLHDGVREPFKQGVSNERSDIRKNLTAQGYGSIINQVGLLERDEMWYICVDPKKIHFPPNDELWEEALRYATEMSSDLME